jgi:hypothetical protein
MSPARTWKKFQESSRVDHSCTYIGGSIALEYAVIDLHNDTLSIDSSALEVACPPPGHGRKIRKILETITPPLTKLATLVSKVES